MKTFVQITSKNRHLYSILVSTEKRGLVSRLYSMSKIRSRQDLFVTRVNAAAQDLLSTYGSTCFGVKIDYNYGLRRRKLLVRNPFPRPRIVYQTVKVTGRVRLPN